MLHKLWYGDLSPCERVKADHEYEVAVREAAEIEEDISASATITQDQVKNLKLSYARIAAIGKETAFLEGLKFGTRFCFEALSAEE